MKTLIINGSPRRDGDTVSLITELKKYLHGEIQVVNTYYDDIKPCIDCRYCWTNSKCAINDNMQDIYKKLNQVDNVIIASPIYFSQLPGPLLNFASRLQYFYVSRYIRKDKNFSIKKKTGSLILVGGGDGSPEPAIKTAKILFQQMNAEMISCLCSLKTNTIPAKQDKKVMMEVADLAEKLNRYQHKVK